MVYRAKLSTTIFSARQLINHGHVKVNGRKVDIPSYQVKDSIEIRDKSKQLAIIDIALIMKNSRIYSSR